MYLYKCSFRDTNYMFRTEIPPVKARFNVDLNTGILSMGSCFANDMGQRLSAHKFRATTNPGGILFNPLSLFQLIETSVNDLLPPSSTFLEHEGIHMNHLFHSEVYGSTKATLDERITEVKKQVKEAIEKADLIILTFGTAWVYELKAGNILVANCHKVPQSHFEKRLLSVDEIVSRFTRIREMIKGFNPGARFLLTVSPVRHVKDTMPLNNVSKSVLRLACHQIREQFEEVDYFPSYELMLDDLRDYRFYKKDMLHPNEQAIDYIWQKFTTSFFSSAAQAFTWEWSKLRAAMQHKAFHPTSAGHQKFLKDLILKVQNLSDRVDVSKELSDLKSQLI